MTLFQILISNGTKQAMDAFSGQTLTWRGQTIRCDLGEEQDDFQNQIGGQSRVFVQPVLIRKAAIPSGMAFAVGDLVTINGARKEIASFDQDEISVTIRLVQPRQK